MDRAHGRGYEAYHQRWSDKLLLVTEFSNPHPALLKAEKGAQYCEYHRSLPAYVGAAFCFVLSASAPAFAGETWREESGVLSPIPAIIGSC